MKNWRSKLLWLGLALIVIGIIIILAIMPGWLWCLLGALILIVAGILLARPFLFR